MTRAAAHPQEMGGLRILADDLTGALDSAAAFARDDAPVPVAIHGLCPASAWPGATAPMSAIATGSRDIPPAELPAMLAPWLDSFCGAPDLPDAQRPLAFKKVDSLLRGNTFAELAWLARSGRFSRLILAPAFPDQGRLTLAGRLVRDGAVVNPQGPSLPQALGQALAQAGVPDTLPVEVPEVRTQADLLALAQRAQGPEARGWLWAGSAGLAQALARLWAAPAAKGIGTEPGARPVALTSVGVAPAAVAPLAPLAPTGPLLLLSASHQGVTRQQFARLVADHPQAIVARAGDEAQLAQALRAMRQPHALALLELSPLHALSAAEAATLLQRQLALLTEPATGARRPGTLVVVGGDTLLGLIQASGAHALQALPAQRPGWGRALWQGGAWHGLVCHSRSGAFGGPDDLQQLLATLPPPVA